MTTLPKEDQMKKLFILLAIGAGIFASQASHASANASQPVAAPESKPPCPFMAKNGSWTDDHTARITPPVESEARAARGKTANVVQ
jgi:hypothetical protein